MNGVSSRLNTQSKELHLLLLILGLEKEQRQFEQIKDVIQEGIDWSTFLELTLHHRVYPSIHYNLKQLSNEGIQFPSSVVNDLNLNYMKNTFTMMNISAEMDKLCKGLHEQQIRTLMLKGPVLAQAIYGDISLRTSKDLDMLVSVDDVEETEAFLLRSGYTLTEEKPRILKDWKIKDHHLSYFNAKSNVQIEVHWRLNPEMGREPSFDELWARRNASLITGTPIYYLGNEDLFLYLVSHGARHAWFRLRWLLDIHQLVGMNLVSSKLMQVLQKHECTQLAGQALLLASKLFGTRLSTEMDRLTTGKKVHDLADRAIHFIQFVDRLAPTKEYKSYLFRIKTNRQKLSFVHSQLYPSSWDALTLPLPRQLHFLYIPLRPLLWLWRRMKQQVLS